MKWFKDFVEYITFDMDSALEKLKNDSIKMRDEMTDHQRNFIRANSHKDLDMVIAELEQRISKLEE